MKTSLPDDFTPEIWETVSQGQTARFLVCAKRWVHPSHTIGPAGERVYKWIYHPVAIIIGSPAFVFYGLKDDVCSWNSSAPNDHGISTSCAAKALSEAWRGVDDIKPLSWPAVDFHFHYKAKVALPNDENAKAQEITMLRNVNAWIRWDSWKKRGLTIKERAAELTAMGIPTTEKQLEKAAENAGVW